MRLDRAKSERNVFNLKALDAHGNGGLTEIAGAFDFFVYEWRRA